MPIHVRYKEHPQEVLGKPTPTPGDVREFARYVALQEALHIFPDSEKIRRLAAGLGERRSKLGVALHVHNCGPCNETYRILYDSFRELYATDVSHENRPAGERL